MAAGLPAQLLVPVDTGLGAFAARLSGDAHEARARCLQSSLHAAKIRHAEEVVDLEAQLMSSRTEVAQLSASLVQHEQQLGVTQAKVAELQASVTERDVILAERAREVTRLQALVHVRDAEVQRLHTQITLLLSQLDQSQGDASAARIDKERLLMPLSVQAEQMGRNLATKERQIKLLQQEMGSVHQKTAEVQAVAALRQDEAVKFQCSQQAELAFQSDKIRHLEAQLETQASLHRQKEQQLNDRCRLLQAWCFRTWWSLEAGDSWPGLVPDDAVPEMAPPAERRTRVMRPAQGNDATTLVEAPLPENWRSVLRFQASLFHWLTAETLRRKALRLESDSPDVETHLPLPLSKADEKRERALSRKGTRP